MTSVVMRKEEDWRATHSGITVLRSLGFILEVMGNSWMVLVKKKGAAVNFAL